MYKTYAKNIIRKKNRDMSKAIEQQFIKNRIKDQGKIDGIKAKIKNLELLLDKTLNEYDKKWMKDKISALNESLKELCKK